MILAIFGNPYQGSYRILLGQLFSILNKDIPDVEFRFERDFYDWLRSRAVDLPAGATTIGDGEFYADICLSFGGDGTFLHTARRVGASGIPIMGINTGHLGYLTTAGISDPEATAAIIVSKRYNIEDRAMLRATVTDESGTTEFDALNEIAITKQDTASMIEVHARVDRTLLADYRADGLIISTPTGSTGYNLSVGGPVVAPSTGVWIISPIAAHTLTMRPLVIPDSVTIGLTVDSRSGTFLMSNDGVSHALKTSAKIDVRRAPYVTRIISAQDHDFVETLRDKLSWGI